MFGDISDLNKAVDLFREAVRIAEHGSQLRTVLLIDLAVTYCKRYTVCDSERDFDSSIQSFREATEELYEFDLLDLILQGQGALFFQRFRRTGKVKDFEKATGFYHSSIESAGNKSETQRISQMGAALCHRLRYNTGGPIIHLEVGISLLENAANVVPSGHIDYSAIFSQLGEMYNTKYKRSKTDSDLDTAINYYGKAVQANWEHIEHKLNVCHQLLRIYIRAQKWKYALNLVESSMNLIQQFAPRFLDTSESHALLGRLNGLASLAGAVLLSSGATPQAAAEMIDRGRGVVAGFTTESRIDENRISRTVPGLEKEYAALRGKLSGDVTPMSSQSIFRYMSGWISTNHELDEWFSKAELQRSSGRLPIRMNMGNVDPGIVSRYGKVVVVNVSYRCDALIIAHKVQALPLPNLSESDIKERAQKGNCGSSETLEWLWNCVAAPVLDALGLTEPPADENWPHIWWVTTGALSRFPLHAAGRHSERSNETVIDRAMSSYSQSVWSWMESKFAAFSQTSTKAVMVAMQNTPGSAPLRFVSEEVNITKDILESMSMKVMEPECRKDDVISHFKDCNIFHFAGHGFTHPDSPLKSHLRLKDWKEAPLQVADLLEINLRERPPFLAYLSACGTSQIKDERYLDESMHLISACQLAGFRHVIGTLWQVNDETCVDVARITYEVIKEHDMSDESVCLGLHKATRALRDRWLQEAHEKIEPKSSTSYTKQRLKLREVPESRELTAPGQFRVERDIIDDENEELGPGLWVPYIHYGM